MFYDRNPNPGLARADGMPMGKPITGGRVRTAAMSRRAGGA